MNVENGTEAAQFPEKEYINGIFLAVHDSIMHDGWYYLRKATICSSWPWFKVPAWIITTMNGLYGFYRIYSY